MLPRLQAEESAREAERIAMGTGSFSRSDQREVRESWRRAMHGPARRSSAKVAMQAADFAAIGIGVIVEERTRG